MMFWSLFVLSVFLFWFDLIKNNNFVRCFFVVESASGLREEKQLCEVVSFCCFLMLCFWLSVVGMVGCCYDVWMCQEGLGSASDSTKINFFLSKTSSLILAASFCFATTNILLATRDSRLQEILWSWGFAGSGVKSKTKCLLSWIEQHVIKSSDSKIQK